MAKTISTAVNDYGCPTTEMRSRSVAFEAAHQNSGLDFFMKPDAPHYAASATRIAFMVWADTQTADIIQFPGVAQ